VIQEAAGSTEALPGRIRHGWCDPSPLDVRVCLFHDTFNKQGRCFNERRVPPPVGKLGLLLED
jgi:hypothetical protein